VGIPSTQSGDLKQQHKVKGGYSRALGAAEQQQGIPSSSRQPTGAEIGTQVTLLKVDPLSSFNINIIISHV
jgi:hypothetical protein